MRHSARVAKSLLQDIDHAVVPRPLVDRALVVVPGLGKYDRVVVTVKSDLTTQADVAIARLCDRGGIDAISTLSPSGLVEVAYLGNEDVGDTDSETIIPELRHRRSVRANALADRGIVGLALLEDEAGAAIARLGDRYRAVIAHSGKALLDPADIVGAGLGDEGGVVVATGKALVDLADVASAALVERCCVVAASLEDTRIPVISRLIDIADIHRTALDDKAGAGAAGLGYIGSVAKAIDRAGFGDSAGVACDRLHHGCRAVEAVLIDQ